MSHLFVIHRKQIIAALEPSISGTRRVGLNFEHTTPIHALIDATIDFADTQRIEFLLYLDLTL